MKIKKIQNMIIDEPKETIEIIYNLRNNGTLMSYEYANNLMTLVSAELIYNLTGFSVTSKIEGITFLTLYKILFQFQFF